MRGRGQDLGAAQGVLVGDPQRTQGGNGRNPFHKKILGPVLPSLHQPGLTPGGVEKALRGTGREDFDSSPRTSRVRIF